MKKKNLRYKVEEASEKFNGTSCRTWLGLYLTIQYTKGPSNSCYAFSLSVWEKKTLHWFFGRRKPCIGSLGEGNSALVLWEKETLHWFFGRRKHALVLGKWKPAL
jgi:hypothetical protein